MATPPSWDSIGADGCFVSIEKGTVAEACAKWPESRLIAAKNWVIVFDDQKIFVGAGEIKKLCEGPPIS